MWNCAKSSLCIEPVAGYCDYWWKSARSMLWQLHIRLIASMRPSASYRHPQNPQKGYDSSCILMWPLPCVLCTVQQAVFLDLRNCALGLNQDVEIRNYAIWKQLVTIVSMFSVLAGYGPGELD